MKIAQAMFILTIVMSLLLSYSIVSNSIKSFYLIEQDLIFGFLVPIGIFLAKIGLGVIVFSSIMKILKKRAFSYFLPLILSTSSLIFATVAWYKINKRESSPIILKAHYNGDLNGLSLNLRENNTYKIEDFGFLGATEYFGKYKINGDTIYLDTDFPLGKERDIMDNKLLIVDSTILIKADSHGIYQPNQPLQMRIIK